MLKATGALSHDCSWSSTFLEGKVLMYSFQLFYRDIRVSQTTFTMNSFLFNSEAWYNVTSSDIDELEKMDEMLLRRILECPASTPKEMLYLELACTPIRFILMSRRILFLHSILEETETSLVQRFFQAQLRNPTKGDWCQSVLKSLGDLKLDLNFNQIKLLKKEQLQKMVKSACEKSALEYLNQIKLKHSKVMDLQHKCWGKQEYLKPNQISIQEAKFIFLLRTRMLDVKCNFRNKYSDVKCPNCESDDSQAHILQCEKLVDTTSIASDLPKYENIFEANCEKVLSVSRIISQNFSKRNKLKSQKNVNHVNPDSVFCSSIAVLE